MQWVMDGIILVLRSTSWVKQGPAQKEKEACEATILQAIKKYDNELFPGGGELSRMNSAFTG